METPTLLDDLTPESLSDIKDLFGFITGSIIPSNLWKDNISFLKARYPFVTSRLELAVLMAEVVYTFQLTFDDRREDTLSDIEEQAAELIELLNNPANTDHMIYFLGMGKGQTYMLFDATEEIAKTRESLKFLQSTAHHARLARPKRKKEKIDKFEVSVSKIAQYWRERYGENYGQSFYPMGKGKYEPSNKATAFTYDIIKLAYGATRYKNGNALTVYMDERKIDHQLASSVRTAMIRVNSGKKPLANRTSD